MMGTLSELIQASLGDIGYTLPGGILLRPASWAQPGASLRAIFRIFESNPKGQGAGVHMNTVFQSVEQLTRQCLVAWQDTSERQPAGLQRFTQREQSENEQEIEVLLKRASQQLAHQGPINPRQRAALVKRVGTAITRSLLRNDVPSVNTFMQSCGNAGEAFTRMAWDFDPAISDRDVFQGLRNQWVFNSIQEYLGYAIAVTPSSFAYSMLYPYTDNRIDRFGEVSADAQMFIAWLTHRLHYGSGSSDNPTQEKVGALLDMIDGQYPRAAFPDVHAGLMAIHVAQEKSLSLQGEFPADGEAGLLSVTIEKGGSSVLADGLLVAGSLTMEMVEAMFVYGVILQYIDDLQDIYEDAAAGHSTVFTLALGKGRLEEHTNRLLNHLHWCLSKMQRRADASRATLCGLIGSSCAHLVLEALAEQRDAHDRRYLAAMEQYMPLRIEYFGGMKQRVNEYLSLDGEADCPALPGVAARAPRASTLRRAMMGTYEPTPREQRDF